LLSIWYPPEFPKLPQGYSEWKEYKSYPFIRKNPHFDEYKYSVILDPSVIPYHINYEPLNKTYPCGDSLLGEVQYVDTIRTTKLELYIAWFPHEELDTINRSLLYDYGGYISYDTIGFEKIVIDEKDAWRIRGKWWQVTCDGGVQISGSFTNYFIPTEKLDYRITCLSRFYLYDILGPDPLGFEHYPDRIAELERAVEQTFRPK